MESFIRLLVQYLWHCGITQFLWDCVVMAYAHPRRVLIVGAIIEFCLAVRYALPIATMFGAYPLALSILAPIFYLWLTTMKGR